MVYRQYTAVKQNYNVIKQSSWLMPVNQLFVWNYMSLWCGCIQQRQFVIA